MLQRTQILHMDLFAFENMKKTPEKWDTYYFSKIDEVFISALANQMVQIVTFLFSNVADIPTVHKTGFV